MKTIDISALQHLTLDTEEKIFLTGQTESFELQVAPETHIQLFLQAEIKNFHCNIGENSLLKLVWISAQEKKNSIFDLEKEAELQLKVIVISKIFEDTEVNLNAEDARFFGEYLVLAKDSENFVQTKVVHQAPKTFSEIKNFGIATKGGKIHFETIGKIAKGNFKAQCEQISRGLILQDDAKISSRPILLIDEVDMQAHHGAAIGKISEDELFYLMSRGLTKNEAEMLIVNGIIEPFLENLGEDLKNKLETKITSFLTLSL